MDVKYDKDETIPMEIHGHTHPGEDPDTDGAGFAALVIAGATTAVALIEAVITGASLSPGVYGVLYTASGIVLTVAALLHVIGKKRAKTWKTEEIDSETAYDLKHLIEIMKRNGIAVPALAKNPITNADLATWCEQAQSNIRQFHTDRLNKAFAATYVHDSGTTDAQ